MIGDTNCISYAVLPSTNAEARRLIEEGEITGEACVTAKRQTGGRGRRGRTWHSPIGGLWMTQIINPRIPRDRWSLYPLMAGVAASEAVWSSFGVRCDLKWPNDLWCSGCKLGGILCETVQEYMLIGLGINVQINLSDLKDISDPRATDLAEAGGTISGDVPLAVDELRRAVQRQLYRQHRVLTETPDVLLKSYRNRCLLMDRCVQVTGETDSFFGRARCVEEDGALLVERCGGTLQRVRAGDVTLRLEAGVDE